MVPRLVVNAKLYPEVTDPVRLQALAKALAECARPGNPVALVPPVVHLGLLGAHPIAGLALVGPHADPLAPGVGTGHVSAQSLRAAGCAGLLLNHAEHKLPHATLAATMERARAEGLWILLCADSTAEARALAALRPDAIAIEPPELIGGDVSVTSANPAIVRDAVAAVHTVVPGLPVLCGAGVKGGADARAARALGAYGVLVASGVVKAKDPAAAAADLAAGLA